MEWRQSEDESIHFQTSSQKANLILFHRDTDDIDPELERLCAINWQGEDISEQLPKKLRQDGLKHYKSVVFNAPGTMLYVLTAEPLTVHLFPIQGSSFLPPSLVSLVETMYIHRWESFYNLYVYDNMLFVAIWNTIFMFDLSSVEATTRSLRPVCVVHGPGWIYSIVCLHPHQVVFTCTGDSHFYSFSLTMHGTNEEN